MIVLPSYEVMNLIAFPRFSYFNDIDLYTGWVVQFRIIQLNSFLNYENEMLLLYYFLLHLSISLAASRLVSTLNFQTISFPTSYYKYCYAPSIAMETYMFK